MFNIERKDITSVKGDNSKCSGDNSKGNGPINDDGICVAEVQNAMLSSFGNPGNIDQSSTSIGVSSSTNKYLSNNSVLYQDKITEMEPLLLLHSSESHSTTTISDSDFFYGYCTDPCTSTCSNSNDTYTSVRNLKEGLRDIRREMENICPGGHFDENTYNMNGDFIRKRRRKSRRRGRGNWLPEADYVTSFEELKSSKIQHCSQMNFEVSVAQVRSRRINEKCEKEKVNMLLL